MLTPKPRNIVHFDLDTFFVSVERLMDSRLNNKPVLIGGTSDRGVVASCSYETRKLGIHSGMPMRLARQLCPEAIIVKGNSGSYMKYSDIIAEIISEEVPLFERTSVDEFYADLTGMEKFFGTYQLSSELRQRIIKETNLPISFGLSSSKTVSKIATGEAKPNNQMKIHFGEEKHFMAPLSVRKIPMVGEATHKNLLDLGVKKIITLQEMHVDLLERVFGKPGRTLWNKAQGIDNSQVIQHQERKSISTERTFDKDTIDIEKLKGILTAMTENLAFQLRRGNKVAACISVRVRYSDFQTHEKQMNIAYSSADHILIHTAQELFKRIYDRRVLVRLIGVRFSKLVTGGYQINLLEDSEELVNLYQAMDKIRDSYGDRAVMRASGINARSIGRGNPFQGGPPPLLANRRR